jgi:hypothetical protein
VIGLASLGYLAYQIWFGATASSAVAVVDSFEAKRRGRGDALVTYESAGQKVQARMWTWVWLGELSPGQEVTILYQPDKLDTVQLDDARQRYWPALGVLLLSLLVVVFEGRRALRPSPVQTGAVKQ